MVCPYLEEVVMLFCRAHPVRKMVPKNRITTACQCFGDNFQGCPLFREVMTPVRWLAETERAPAHSGPAKGEEGS